MRASPPSQVPDRVERFEVAPGAAGDRLDAWLAGKLAEVSRTRLKALVADGRVSVDGRAVKASVRLKAGQRVVVAVPPPPAEVLTAEPIPLRVIYEDAHVLVVDKPAPLVVHPGAGRHTGTLAHALLAHAPVTAGVGGRGRPGIVHRLDKGTSGLLAVAKSQEAYAGLTAQLAARRVTRRYVALVHGEVQRAEGVIDAPIGRHPRQRIRMAVLPPGKGRRALTRFRVLERFKGYSYLEVQLETGRTHQIRVHLASIAHPVVGDQTYRPRATPPITDPPLAALVEGLDGTALHAAVLGFAHPVTGEWLEFRAPPERLEPLLAHLRLTLSPSPPPLPLGGRGPRRGGPA
jgi:23S rRNA pseudouridine1911/1915/1917 synthase